jgi:putative transposase
MHHPRPVTPADDIYLISARVARWTVLRASSSASKDAARPPREEVAMLRRQNPGPKLDWVDRAVIAANQ